ncbi:MAG: MerR family transcriptional regulator [Candidatus Aenigmarchaeota archaeon]|nr:MerR family transcriptional regulator [Candidatus Aenigmarchaeota archaeon]
MVQRMTITEVAEKLGVTAKTVIRWEQSGKVGNPKRDWRGWRLYDEDNLQELLRFKEARDGNPPSMTSVSGTRYHFD